MHAKPSTWILAAAVFCSVGVGAWVVTRHQGEAVSFRESDSLVNAVYVWQHKWSSDVVSGIEKASGVCAAFMVLGGEITLDDGEPRCRMPDVDWPALGATKRPVWVVLRVHELPGIERAEGRDASTDLLAGVTRTLLDEMHRCGIEASGVQLDYDCAAEDLGHYASLLRLFRERFPATPVSLTALPSWLNQRELPNALAEVDHYILQVHSIEPPRQNDDAVSLCEAARVPGWIREASSLGVPFYLALPTYGYRLVFAPGGEFAGLMAEDSEELRPGFTTREVMAEPAEIAGVVRAIRSEPPPLLLGMAWFRLPVEGDRLNWTWPLLEKVMKGEAPELDMRADVRNPSSGLYEVWIVNDGVFRPMEPIQVRVDWINSSLAAHDALAGFRFDTVSDGAGDLVGKAPGPGEERMAAWFRLVPGEGREAPALRAGEVEVRK